MCTAQLQAVGQAKPGPIRPGQVRPKSRPDHGFGMAGDSGKPKLLAQAMAFDCNFCTRRVYTRLSNNNFGIMPQIIAIFRMCLKKEN
jgi:hypothetical protein